MNKPISSASTGRPPSKVTTSTELESELEGEDRMQKPINHLYLVAPASTTLKAKRIY
jgi:hypothetical protein